MSDSKYFTNTKKGEIFELKAELNSEKRERKKDAVKKIIANMTVGKDVSALFPDVVNCMQTANLELKKLVYLYLMNYAKTQPDLTILAVNTFQKDCLDPNPLLRALAVRTMGCIRVDKITEYLCDPLRKCLQDEDPYVRKTAAVCVAKLYDISPELVEEQGFISSLRDMVSDSNPMVVANAVAALSEINDSSAEDVMMINSGTLIKLLAALNECTEWGQIFILDCLGAIEPKDSREAESICERVMPRLQHANAAVVLSAVKIVLKYSNFIENEEKVAMLGKKLTPPLISLLSTEPEVQFVALRNINLIVQKRPDILKHEMKVFFVKYNDPIYVKLEKLDIMIRLAGEHNISQVLAELKEYSTEVDVDFVRKAVRAIGRCAIKIEHSADKCISTLIELIETKVNYVVQEAVVVIKDIFRKYPNQYESIIGSLCENLDTLDEPEAKASMIWIIGEYADRIDNADELLESFLDTFQDEGTQVQLSLLTAIVKLFLKKPHDTQDLVQKVLGLATEDSDNPDLRDRGYIYWRLLSTDPGAAKSIVLCEKPRISEETDMLDPVLLDELIANISTLSSVYHKPPSAFIDNRVPVAKIDMSSNAIQSFSDRSSSNNSHPNANTNGQTSSHNDYNENHQGQLQQQDDLLGDLLGLDLNSTSNENNNFDPLGGLGGSGLQDVYGATSNNNGGSAGPDLNLLENFQGMRGGNVSSTTNNTNNNGNMMFGGPGSNGSGTGVGGGGSGSGSGSGLDNLLGFGNSDSGLGSTSAAQGNQYEPCKMPMQVWLDAQKGKGLEVNGCFHRKNQQIYMELIFTNKSQQDISNLAVQFNKNSFGLSPASPLKLTNPNISPNSSVSTSLALNVQGPVQVMNPINQLQIAVRSNIEVHYIDCIVPLYVLFIENGQFDRNAYPDAYQTLSDKEVSKSIHVSNINSISQLEAKLHSNNIFTVSTRSPNGVDTLYASVKFTNNIVAFVLASVSNGSLNVTIRSSSKNVLSGIADALDIILAN